MKRSRLGRTNLSFARSTWGELGKAQLIQLKELSDTYEMSIALGDLLYLDNRIYVTHVGLLRLAKKRRCLGIRVCEIREFCDPKASRWVFKASVYKAPGSKSFVGYGDADPSNVSPLVRGAEMRVAETRAVNRALRKAYGIGLCSVEELGFLSSRSEPAEKKGSAPVPSNGNGNGSRNVQPRLRDRLCLLIRQHQLDPTLVKLYAADFCGTQELREAGRDLVESFVTHISDWAARDRASLLCKLQSYATPQEVKP
jgi:hypothetical protein